MVFHQNKESSFLLKHANLFAELGADQGHTNLIKHKIDTVDAKPICQQPKKHSMMCHQEDILVDRKLLQKKKQSFYWPVMNKDVRRWCAFCQHCAKRKKYSKLLVRLCKLPEQEIQEKELRLTS